MSREELSNQELREAFAARRERTVPDEDCPQSELIWRAVRRELPARRIRAIGLHATTCPACAEAWQLARDVDRDVRQPVAVVLRPRSRASVFHRWWAPAALAAAAAILVFVAITPLGPVLDPTIEGTLRGGEEAIRTLLPAGVPLGRERCVLRWDGPEGSRYDVRVAREDLSVITEVFDLEAPELTLSEELTDLPSGARVIWQVYATLPDGRRVASRTFTETLE